MNIVKKEFQMVLIDRPNFFKQRKRKYADIYDAMIGIKKGKALRITFITKKDARIAAVSIRCHLSRLYRNKTIKKVKHTLYVLGEDIYITLRNDKITGSH